MTRCYYKRSEYTSYSRRPESRPRIPQCGTMALLHCHANDERLWSTNKPRKASSTTDQDKWQTSSRTLGFEPVWRNGRVFVVWLRLLLICRTWFEEWLYQLPIRSHFVNIGFVDFSLNSNFSGRHGFRIERSLLHSLRCRAVPRQVAHFLRVLGTNIFGLLDKLQKELILFATPALAVLFKGKSRQ